MTRTTPTRWLRDKAAQGLVELPSNAAWLLEKAFTDGQGSSSSGSAGSSGDGPVQALRNGADKVRAAASDTLPFVPDSLEGRIRQAQQAVASAREHERAATEAAQQARQASADAAATADDNAKRLAEGRAARDADVAQRVAAAREEADRQVAEARAKAEQDGDARLAKLQGEVDQENAKAQKRAESARDKAQQQVDDAASRMAQARSLADDAARAAQEAADAAHQEAERLAKDAGHHADEADDRLATVQQLEHEVTVETAHAVRHARDNDEVADLRDQTREQLLELANGLGVSGRSHMRKAELVTAVKKATAAAR